MWAIIFAILLCTQYYISGGNRPKNEKMKFHAQNKSVFLTETTNQPTNWAKTLGNSISTTQTNEINFTSHSSDHSLQEAITENTLCLQRIDLCTKNSKKCISISADIDLTSGFSLWKQISQTKTGNWKNSAVIHFLRP
jgi:hypothetical protein